ncbi:PH, RCC1 and FYVE domains-containing protein 1-like [Bidens hawaiensis]|uniref:PH, RCC1 and FYVE domains-containing protein 1-like n=1 Tax=Bidens hawaiensis TaxID=980011 RepID=UPI00404ADAC1
MADLAHIDQALIALKKGAHLRKYGRKGKPRFCPFRLSHDEASLICISSSGEKSLKLATISRIIPGQRTAVFRRYPRPEKDYLSFSIIYNNRKRSLDLICKDKVEAEVWITGLKSIVSSLQGGRSKIDGWNDEGLYIYDDKDLASNSTSASSVSSDPTTSPVGPTNMQLKGSSSDAFRVSVSSQPSTSSHGSGPDDNDSLGDVYIWGEIISETDYSSTRTDVLLPRPLESNIVLDVSFIACGVRHAGLVTKQGELFTWGEESGGRLGHGIGKDVTHPRLVESLSLSVSNINSVACGEFHTCAVTSSGEVYTWGDGTHNVGLLGHGNEVNHWLPKRISGSFEGVQVGSVTCGPWHTALITLTGRLFTFGDGTFGVLGHGDRVNVSYPKEVESLSGLRTISVACGVWHTAAVVDVIATQSSSNINSGKLFTWGDGDKNCLGHGDKEARLQPTCVPALIDYNFHKVACGHSLTVSLTTSGHVYTMGSTVYGQLGNPDCDGKLPCLVEGKLLNSPVEEISCGAYHVAVLTSKNEVYTWGKGANGRLGHGDVEDRKTPTIVESLKDRYIKNISCGSNYTTAICVHKWVSGAEQSQCSSCRQAFGFTRKRHNCYNCGLVHCHSCSSKKAPRAALAPNPGKPYRVCDSCFTKLSKTVETGPTGISSRRNVKPRLSGENKDRLDKTELKLAKSGAPSNQDLIKLLDTKAVKQGKKGDVFLGRSTQGQTLMQLKDVVLLSDFRQMVPKPVNISSGVSSRSVSPFSRRSSPSRSATPVPTTSGLSISKGAAESFKKTNENLNQEVITLRRQVESLRNECDAKESELQKSRKQAQEAMMLAAEESAKCKAAKDVIKTLMAQLKDMTERLPPGSYDFESMMSANTLKQNGVLHSADVNGSPRPTETLTRTIEPTRDEYPNGATVRPGTHNHVENVVPAPPENEENKNDSSNNNYKPSSPVSTVTTTTTVTTTHHVESEWIEQYEPGVYITLTALGDGTRDLKRVRFSRRRFGEHQAEIWWSENREQVYERYNVRGSNKSSVSSAGVDRRSGESVAPPARY